tara:strand:+ start:455 stop:919 length:465 start_codon:yes stop_codon:yes gene_type:complete
MYKIILFILCFFISNCTFNKVVKNHGVHNLNVKQDKLILKKSNKNDIITLLGPPSTKSTFDNDMWIYMERKTSKGSIFTLGKKFLMTNNVLVLEINNKGLLEKKQFFNINDMNDLSFSAKKTEIMYSKESFIYDFLSSMRQKVNDPLGKRKKLN